MSVKLEFAEVASMLTDSPSSIRLGQKLSTLNAAIFHKSTINCEGAEKREYFEVPIYPYVVSSEISASFQIVK